MQPKIQTKIHSTALLFLTVFSFAMAAVSRAQEARDIEADDINVIRFGTYYGEDDSYAVQLDMDIPVTDATRINVGGAYIRATGEQQNIDAYQANLGVDHRFGDWGFGIEGNYRNDDTIITTIGARGRAYYRTDKMNVGVRVGRSRIEVSYDFGPLLRPYFDDSASDYTNEYGLDLRYSFGALSLYANGTDYDYDQPLSSLAPQRNGRSLPINRLPELQERLARLRARLGVLNFASLRIATNLLDYSGTFGADYTIGEHVINLEASRQRVAVDEVDIDSIDIGWTIPLWQAADLELRLGNAKIHDGDSLFYGSVNFTFYR